MIRAFTVLLALAFVTMAMTPASAWAVYDDKLACDVLIQQVDNDDTTYYVAIDLVTGFSVWIYQESNDVAGLQRSDGDICANLNEHSVTGDTILF